LVVFDTCIEDLPETDRPWGKGNNPRTALDEFLKYNNRFVVENLDKLMITVAPGGYLRCV
jgi:cephalosporin hydroxylase